MIETGKKDLVLGVVFLALWAVVFAWVIYTYNATQNGQEVLADKSQVRLFFIMNAGSILLLILGIQRLVNYFRARKTGK